MNTWLRQLYTFFLHTQHWIIKKFTIYLTFTDRRAQKNRGEILIPQFPTIHFETWYPFVSARIIQWSVALISPRKMTPVSTCRKTPTDICQMPSTKRLMPVILYLPNNFLLLSHDHLRGWGYIKFDHVETITKCFKMKMVISQKK